MVSTTEFLNALTQSNLLSEELLARIRKRVAESAGSVDPRGIAKYLIDKGHLTLWQANQLLAGRQAFYLGRYKLLDRIGQGGMGVVFKAQHAVMERVVALKVMARSLLNNPQAVARFNREVKTAAALNHPNIITAYDADAVGNTHFLVMEYVDGRDLNAWLKAHGPLPIGAACECALQAASGLAYAQRQGMVHRDIKPVNLLVTWNAETHRPVVKILDLGLARFVSESQEEGGLTRLGQTIGTPDYIAPEAAESFKDADVRADIFSLGCTLFKLLTGKLPFAGENTMEKLLARTKGDAPLIRTVRPDVPAGLEAVVVKMLARDPRDRYQSPAEVIAALKPFAASTSGATADLEFFSRPLDETKTIRTSDIQADADTSLAEFFRDFSVSPVREEKPPPQPAVTDDDALELAPLDDEPAPKPMAPTISAPSPTSSSQPETKKKTPAAERISKKESPLVTLDESDPDEELVSRLAGGGSRLAEAMRQPGLQKSSVRLSPPRRNVWDSPLLMVGGGALLLLIILVGALTWSINRRTGDEMYKVASDAYKNGSYSQAVRDYTSFLEAFPDHENASTARVFRGLAQMREATSGATDWSRALAVTEQALSQISGELKFADARAELASILPHLAGGLAGEAHRAKNPQLVEQAQTALDLIDKYVPKESRPVQRINEIVHSLKVTSREIARTSALTQTVADMKSAAEKGQTADAYALRRKLIKTYPDLENDPALQEAVLAVAAAEQNAVKTDATRRPAETTEPDSPLLGTASLASRQGKNAPAVEGNVVYVMSSGAVFALDATTGELLWRRRVGNDAPPLPVNISAEPGSDVLLVDSNDWRLARVDARGGKLRWRQSLGGPVAGSPVVAAGRAWVATQAGKLLAVDADSGELTLSVQLPQTLRTAPSFDASAKRLCQIGEHSSLFILAADSGECQQVYYLGHEAGTISVPPLPVSRYLFVAENHLLDNARLRVLLAGENGGSFEQVAALPLDGHVHVSPQVVDRSLYVVTDRGAVYGFEIGNPGQGDPLLPQADAPATSSEHLLRLFVARPAQLWVASNQLNRYDVQLARGRLYPAAERYQGDTFQEPLVVIGSVLFHTRRRAGASSVILSAVDLRTGDPYWETELAAPVAALFPAEPSHEAYALSSPGRLFKVPSEIRGSLVQNQPSLAAEGANSLRGKVQSLALSNDQVVFCSNSEQPAAALLKLENGAPQSLTWLDTQDWTAGAQNFRGAIAVPGTGGVVRLLDPISGRPVAEPFAPAREPDEIANWFEPASYGSDHLLIADDRSRLFLLVREDQPIPHLAASQQVLLPSRIRLGPAIASDMAYVISLDNAIVPISLPQLKPGEPHALPGFVYWGPQTIGGAVYLATDDGQLWMLDGGPSPRWHVSIGDHDHLGVVELGDHVALVTDRGAVARLDRTTGRELARVETSEQFTGQAVAVGDDLLAASMDGSIHSLAIPR